MVQLEVGDLRYAIYGNVSDLNPSYGLITIEVDQAYSKTVYSNWTDAEVLPELTFSSSKIIGMLPVVFGSSSQIGDPAESCIIQ